MKELNKDTYRALIKGVKPEYDKEALWSAIDSRMSEKKKRRPFVWLFLIGVSIVISGVAFSMVQHSPAKAVKIEKHGVLPVVNDPAATTITTDDKENPVDIAHRSSSSMIEKISPATLPLYTQVDLKENLNAYKPSLQQLGSTIAQKTPDYDSVGKKSSRLQRPIKRQLIQLAPLSYPEMISVEFLPQLVSILQQKSTDPIYHFGLVQQVDLLKRKGLPLSFQLEAGSSQARYASSGVMDSWASVQQDYIEELYHTGLSLAYTLRLASNTALLFGLEVDRRVSRLAFISNNIMTEQIQDDQAYFYIEEDGSISYIPGERTLTTNATRTVQHYNHHYNVGFSLSFLYEWPIGQNLALYGRTGLELLPFSFSSGRGVDPSSAIIPLGMTEYSKNLLRGNIATGLSYRMKSGESLFLGAYFQHDLTNQLKLKETQQWNTFLGLETGFRFRL